MRRAVAALAAVGVAALVAGCSTSVAQEQANDQAAAPEAARIQAVVGADPGVLAATTVTYSDKGIDGTEVDATVTVSPADLDQQRADALVEQLRKLVWLSTIHPVDAVELQLEGSPHQPAIYATGDLGPHATGELTARYGPRPTPSSSS